MLKLAEELGNVSHACKVMGYSRDTFYRYKQVVDKGGVEALVDQSRRKPNIGNRTAPEIEAAIVASCGSHIQLSSIAPGQPAVPVPDRQFFGD